MTPATLRFTVMQFIQENRRGRRVISTQPCWVKAISWGDGDRVKSLTYTTDITQAAHLSSMTALKIGTAYWNYPITLTYHDGAPNVELTAMLVKEQITKGQSHAEMIRKMNAEWKPFLQEMLRAVPSLMEVLKPSTLARIMA